MNSVWSAGLGRNSWQSTPNKSTFVSDLLTWDTHSKKHTKPYFLIDRLTNRSHTKDHIANIPGPSSKQVYSFAIAAVEGRPIANKMSKLPTFSLESPKRGVCGLIRHQPQHHRPKVPTVEVRPIVCGVQPCSSWQGLCCRTRQVVRATHYGSSRQGLCCRLRQE